MKGLIAVAAILLTACASPYGPSGFAGGYVETPYAPNVYRVMFEGNGFTSHQRAADLAFLRGAELALMNGYTHLVITDSQSWERTATIYTQGSATTNTYGSATAYGNTVYGSATSTTTYNPPQPMTVYKPNVGLVVVFTNETENTFDAQFIYDSLSQKYGIKPKN